MFRNLLLATVLMMTPVYAAEVGDDGLHEAAWIQETFKDLREDHEEAVAQGKTLLVIIEQRGCIYCTRMHENVYPDPEIDAALHESFYVVQLNMFGDVEVTDFDGTTLPEKDMVERWNAQFTPMLMFFPPEVPEDAIASQSTIVTLPGAFGRWTTLNLLNWVREGHYAGDESFQRYHARILQERGIVE
ncbi:thioredoxin family protein [Octadecabacter sp. CECT 8868]|uniref:thioredoxin family protein n=1 Tax=Octadecabacter algicola TaxID=2909342 RepID=UPI001F23FE2A|nr:thioredoxin family protein [Octadecabacter algicola]MCF2904137.1 thioredoxin family protein [Octadecabacter algicola]